MQKRIMFISALLLVASLTWAQVAPKWAKKAQKSIVSVLTYGKDGTLLRSGTGFYVDANATAVADYALFCDAYSASVVDMNGDKSEVSLILGADDTYGLVRFRTNASKVTPLRMAESKPVKSDDLWVLYYSKNKIVSCPTATVVDTTMIQDSCVYYSLSSQIEEKYQGCPVFNAEGELVAALQPSTSDKGYAIDADFFNSLCIRAIQSKSANLALSNINIRKGLPESQEEALVYIYFKSRSASNEEYIDLLNQFVESYPDNPEGYIRRATPLIDTYKYDEAEKDLQTYLGLATEKAKAYADVAQTIYTKLLYQPDSAYAAWTYDKAVEYVDKAIELNPLIDHKFLKAQILMAKKDFESAYAVYDAINSSADRSPASYFAAALAAEGRGDSLVAQIALLDSAIALFPEPLPSEAASYVLRRGVLYNKAEKYRAAVLDYNKYCYLSNNQVNASFYYDRAQIEVKARMYQQAIDDMDLAISAEPYNPLYHLEKSALMIRVNMLDECVESAQKCLALAPDNADAYRILGYALLQKGDKEGARLNLNKAVELGDEGAKEIIATYLK